MIKQIIIVAVTIYSYTGFAQYTHNSAAVNNIDLVLNPNPETSIEFESYGSSDDISWVGDYGVTETVADIMARERNNPQPIGEIRESKIEFESPRKELPPNPGIDVSQWPPSELPFYPPVEPMNPQTVGTSFLGIPLSEAGYLPPDCMGDVGPNQVMVVANGRIKVFSKSGVLGPLNATTDAFFSSVRNGSGTSDPHIRYDRLSQRWFVVIINVASSNNRVLIAVSSGPTITGSSSFTFFYFQHNLVSPAGDNGEFADYPTLGIDANALYIGVNNFLGTFNSCTGFVVRKSSILGAGPIVATAFRNLCVSGGAGPFTPQGVDNDDPNSTEGFFIGVDNAYWSRLVVRRISDPGGTPTISGNLNISVPTTYYPLNVPHQGQIGTRYLDALDDRLFAAHIRKDKIAGNSSLWTAHNIRVDASGVGGSGGTRTASRWYEIRDLNSSPALYQSGTLFDGAVTNPQYFWIPSVAMSGQGHMVLSSSRAGTTHYAEIISAGRLSSDALGTTQSFTLAQTSTTSYNVQSANPQRWGDYSQVVVDPNDDMTMWTFQEYCNSTNSWGVRVIQLLAPLPVTPTTATPGAVAPNQTSVDVVITGPSVSGSGFFDPGNDTGGPGYINRISANVGGGITVNSVTFDSPTQVTLNLNTTGAVNGFYDVTITNPDGQSATGTGILEIDEALPVELSSFTAKVLRSGGIRLDWRTETEIDNYGFEIERGQMSNVKRQTEWEKIGFVEGNGNSNSPKEYSFTDNNAPYGNYAYRLKQIDTDGDYEYSNIIEVDAGKIPDGFVLEQNYPNPFNPSTTIKFAVAETQKAELKVFDILGNEVGTLFNAVAEGGKVYEVEFNSQSFRHARDLSSGIYFYRLKTESRVENRKMLLIK